MFSYTVLYPDSNSLNNFFNDIYDVTIASKPFVNRSKAKRCVCNDNSS